MAPNYRKSSSRKGLIIWSESSDTDSDIPPSENLSLKRKKSRLGKIHSACQKDIFLQTSSGESSGFNTKKDNKRKYMTVIQESETTKNTDKGDYHKRFVHRSNKSANASTDESKRKRRKHMTIKHATRMDLASYDKCYRNSNEIVIKEYVRKYEEAEREKRAIAQKFKPFIKKAVENLKNIFSKFRSQVHRLQLKYLRQDIVTLQDVGDTIFIFSSIISKLKEELTEKQQDLTNSYIDKIVKYNSNSVVSNVKYNQCDKDLPECGETSSRSSTSSGMFSPNICKERSIKATGRSSRSVQENDTEKLPLQGTNNSVNTCQTKDTGILQNNGSIVSHLDSSKVVEFVRKPSKEFIVPPKKTEDSKLNTEKSNKNSISASEQLAEDVNSRTAKELIIEIESSSDDTDMSTCSTVMIFSQKDRYNLKRENYVERSPSYDFTLKDELDKKDEASRLYRNSDNMLILPCNKRTKSSVKDLTGKSHNASQLPTKTFVAPSNNRVLDSEQETNFIHPIANKLNRNSCFKTIHSADREEPSFKAREHSRDRRLEMNCKVLVEKFAQ